MDAFTQVKGVIHATRKLFVFPSPTQTFEPRPDHELSAVVQARGCLLDKIRAAG